MIKISTYSVKHKYGDVSLFGNDNLDISTMIRMGTLTSYVIAHRIFIQTRHRLND